VGEIWKTAIRLHASLLGTSIGVQDQSTMRKC